MSSKRDQRAMHWNEIRSRVTTHEGEFLSGKKGRDYQQKWGKKYLGKDIGAAPNIDIRRVEQYEKTGR